MRNTMESVNVGTLEILAKECATVLAFLLTNWIWKLKCDLSIWSTTYSQ